MKKMLLSLLLALPLAAQAVQSDAERIADLERKVARLTEQVNLLLAERGLVGRPVEQSVHVCRLQVFYPQFPLRKNTFGASQTGRIETMPQTVSRHALPGAGNPLRNLPLSCANAKLFFSNVITAKTV